METQPTLGSQLTPELGQSVVRRIESGPGGG
jgi:hypothetical protein